MCIVGGGAFIQPTALSNRYHDENSHHSLRIDVVELSNEVIHMAETWFGLVENTVVRAHCAEGAMFLGACHSNSYDIVVLDASESAGGAELDSPAAGFIDECFLRVTLKRCSH